MAIDLNQDMGELVKSLLNKDKPENGLPATSNSSSFTTKVKPYTSLITSFLLIIASFLAYQELYYKKSIDSINEMQEEVNRLNDLKAKSAQLDIKIKTIKKDLVESQKEFIKNLSHFGNSEDLGELYQSISILAEKYDLTVLNIKELPLPPPPPEPLNKKGKKTNKSKPITKIQEVKVQVELKGSYIKYIKFKEDLAVAEILLKVDEENIKVKTDEQGKVQVNLKLTTYAIDKNLFKEIVPENIDDDIYKQEDE